MDEILFNLISAWPGLIGRPDPELVADCLVLLPFLEDARSLIDVGSGGGLPGLPVKLARPDLAVTLLEADTNKAAFLVQTAARLNLQGVAVVRDRAETAAHQPALRDSFDVAAARALAPMAVLVELCLPFVRVGGRLLAMKVDAEAEVAAAALALEMLGGQLEAIAAAPSALRAGGQVVIVRKVRATPPGYPRRAGMPKRRPLAG